jgi:hypothetical protein
MSQNLCYRRRIIIVPSVLLDSKGKVCTIIQCNSSPTDGVRNGNRRALNSRHTAVCRLWFNTYMYHGTRVGYNAFLTTVPAVLADSLLHCFLLRVGRENEHIQQYVSESVQSSDATKQLLQGEKQLKYYVRVNFTAFCVPLVCNPCCFLHSLGNYFILLCILPS